MKRILLPLFASLILWCRSFAADVRLDATVDLTNAEVKQVLRLYEGASGLDLIVDSRVKDVRWHVTLQPSQPLTKDRILKLIEKALLEQTGVVVTPLDGQRVSVTYNDALPIIGPKKPSRQ